MEKGAEINVGIGHGNVIAAGRGEARGQVLMSGI